MYIVEILSCSKLTAFKRKKKNGESPQFKSIGDSFQIKRFSISMFNLGVGSAVSQLLIPTSADLTFHHIDEILLQHAHKI